MLIELARRRQLRIGKLGSIEFQPGFYAYVGSAMGGLTARIARHLRPNVRKRLHWHIDYFLAAGNVREVFSKTGSMREECSTAHKLEEAFIGIKGFGCSDCHCRSHLFYSPDAQALTSRLENEPLMFTRHDPKQVPSEKDCC